MTVENFIDDPAAICTIRIRPLWMTGAIVRLLQDYFGRASSIQHPSLRERLWTPNEQTGILIEDASVWTPKLEEKRPALIVRRNPWEPRTIAVGDRTGMTEQGHDQYSKQFVGSHTVFCIAKQGAEAELYATETYLFFMHFAPAIREEFGLNRFSLAQIGQLFEVAEAHERYAVPVVVSYGWTEAWTLLRHEPFLKKIVSTSTLVS